MNTYKNTIWHRRKRTDDGLEMFQFPSTDSKCIASGECNAPTACVSHYGIKNEECLSRRIRRGVWVFLTCNDAYQWVPIQCIVLKSIYIFIHMKYWLYKIYINFCTNKYSTIYLHKVVCIFYSLVHWMPCSILFFNQ